MRHLVTEKKAIIQRLKKNTTELKQKQKISFIYNLKFRSFIKFIFNKMLHFEESIERSFMAALYDYKWVRTLAKKYLS